MRHEGATSSPAHSPRVVWHLLSNRWNSAITEYALSAAQSLSLIGFRSVFTPLAGSPAAERSRTAGLETLPVAGFSITHVPQLRRLSDRIRPNHIITYGGPETVVSQWLPSTAPVLRFRGQDIVGDGAWVRLRHRWAHRHVAAILAPSDRLAVALRHLSKKTPVHAVVLGCDSNRYMRVAPLPAEERPRLTVLGRLDPVKGHARILRIFAEVLRVWPRERHRPLLHIVGEPANLGVADIEGYARQADLRMAEDVLLNAERIQDVPRLLATSALGVVCSVGSEIIGRVAEEFLLCGTPIVVSGVGSLEELLFENAGASYAGLNDSDAARLIAAWTLKSMDESEAVKQQRVRDAAARFSWGAMGQQLAAILTHS